MSTGAFTAVVSDRRIRPELLPALAYCTPKRGFTLDLSMARRKGAAQLRAEGRSMLQAWIFAFGASPDRPGPRNLAQSPDRTGHRNTAGGFPQIREALIMKFGFVMAMLVVIGPAFGADSPGSVPALAPPSLLLPKDPGSAPYVMVVTYLTAESNTGAIGVTFQEFSSLSRCEAAIRFLSTQARSVGTKFSGNPASTPRAGGIAK